MRNFGLFLILFTGIVIFGCRESRKDTYVLSAPAGSRYTSIDTEGVTVIPNGRLLTPAGKSLIVAPHPFGLALCRNGEIAVTANSGTSPLSITIIRNLLSNAIKYTHHGGRVTIHVKEREDSGEWVVIRVCDNGVGISAERLPTIFTGNEITTTQGTDSEKGTGIGLKLVHELVTISKGTITIESTPGNGSCFTVTLPGPAHERKGRDLLI